MDEGGEEPHQKPGVESARGLAYYISTNQRSHLLPQFASLLKVFNKASALSRKKVLDTGVFFRKQTEERKGTTEENNQDIRQRFFQVYERFCSEFQLDRGPLEREPNSTIQQNSTDCGQNESQDTSSLCPGCRKSFRTRLGLEIHQRTCQSMSEEVCEPKEKISTDKISCTWCGVQCDTPFALVIHQQKCKRLSGTTGSEDSSSLSDTAKTKEDGSLQPEKMFYCGVCREPAGKDFRELKKHQLFCSKGRKQSYHSSGSQSQNNSCHHHVAVQESSKSNSKEKSNAAAIQNTGYSDSDYHNCEYCGLLCRTLLGLSVHQRKCEEKRRKLIELYGPGALNEVHTCEFCGKQCVSLYGLRIHQRKCLRHNPMPCAENDQPGAKRPRSTHQTEKPHMPDAVSKKPVENETKKCQLSCALCPSAAATSGNFDDFVGPFTNTIGRPGKTSLYVHVECALWAPEVYQDRVTKELCQVYDAYRRSRKKICDYCGEYGAPVPCLHKGCKRSYHYCCLTKANCSMDSTRFEAFCNYHSPKNGSSLNGISVENNIRFSGSYEETQSYKSQISVEQKEVCEVIFSRRLKCISSIVYSEKLPHQFVVPWRGRNCLLLEQVATNDEQLLLFTWSKFEATVKSSPLLSGNESFFLHRYLGRYMKKASWNMQLHALVSSAQTNMHCEVNWVERRKTPNSGVLRDRRKCSKLRRFCWMMEDEASNEMSFGFSQHNNQLKRVEQSGCEEFEQEKVSKEDRPRLKLESRKLEKSYYAHSLSRNDRNVKNSFTEQRKNDVDFGLFGGKEHLRNIFSESGHPDKRAVRAVDTKTVVPLSTTLSFSKSFAGNSQSDKENAQVERNGKSLHLDDIFSVDLDESVVEQVCAPPSEV
jgi:hypothetical protein